MNQRILASIVAVMALGTAGGCSMIQGKSTPSEYADDVALTSKVKADLLENKQVDGLDVNVDAKDGRITLSGYASTAAERDRATQIAQSVSGVKSVDNRIQIKEK